MSKTKVAPQSNPMEGFDAPKLVDDILSDRSLNGSKTALDQYTWAIGKLTPVDLQKVGEELTSQRMFRGGSSSTKSPEDHDDVLKFLDRAIQNLTSRSLEDEIRFRDLG